VVDSVPCGPVGPSVAWRARLGKIVESNPEWADSIAQVMYKTISTLQQADRVQETIDTLKLGLEWIFPYTSTHRLSSTLFLLEAEGVLKEPDTLETLLSAAIERTFAKAEASLGAEEPQAEKSTNRGDGNVKLGGVERHSSKRRNSSEGRGSRRQG